MSEAPTIGRFDLAPAEARGAVGRREGRPEWVVMQRRYHGDMEPPPCFLVHRVGKLRGICECWDESSAQKLASMLNLDDSRFTNSWWMKVERERDEQGV